MNRPGSRLLPEVPPGGRTRPRRTGAARVARLAAPVLLLVLLAACARNAPQSALDPAGPIARTEDNLFKTVFWAAVVPIFVIVEGALLYAFLRFRQRSEADSPVQVHGNTKLEIAWTLVPALILTVVAVPTVRAIFEVSRRPAGDVLDVKVIAHQWWWEYQYPGLGSSPTEPITTANELHIPTGRPVYLTMTTDNVIHSFWVPRLGGKQDVVPGRENHLIIQADEPGTYLGQCAEYCGLSHANMRLRVIAQDPDGFDRWLDEQRRPAAPATEALAARGQQRFQEAPCAGCHAINGTKAAGKVGPDLTHLMSRQTFAGSIKDVSTENLTAWVRDAPSVKPMQPAKGIGMPSGIKDMGLSEEDVRALVAYMETLK